MGLEPQNFDETKLTAKKFVEKVCETGKRTIPHTKMLPQCKHVTKQNCVTLWETDKNGKQVFFFKTQIIYISVYILCFLFVCLYSKNVKTAEPIGPRFFEGPREGLSIKFDF